LSEVSKGVLVRKESFGYLPMPNNVARLSDCISLSGYSREYPRAGITATLAFDLAKQTRIDPFD
jgi:hypothetical protein